MSVFTAVGVALFGIGAELHVIVMALAARRRRAPTCVAHPCRYAATAGPIFNALRLVMNSFDSHQRYCGVAPDVFGNDLERPVYADLHRIAAASLCVRQKASR